MIIVAAALLLPRLVAGVPISIEGAPRDAGYNVGSVVVIDASLRGVSGDLGRYATFADLQYIGTTAVVSVQLDRQADRPADGVRYEGRWPIPLDAPTGLYSVVLRVEDRSARRVVASQKLRGFAVYRKLVRITRIGLDKTFYSPGEPIECEVGIENLTEAEIQGLRVEFSNANYPWISLFSGEPSLSARQPENPSLALKVLREHLSLPAHGEATIPLIPAGTAAFLQGSQVAVLGSGGPPRHEKIPPPETDRYTIAVWNADRTVLYDMQFSAPAIVRAPDRVLPIPYGQNFTHPYNSDLDFSKYRYFYTPGQASAAIQVNHNRTLYRAGEVVRLITKVNNDTGEAWQGVVLRPELTGVRVLEPSSQGVAFDLAPGQSRTVQTAVWAIPASMAPGVYTLKLSLVDSRGELKATTMIEVAVNSLPASLLVFCPHEDDEHAYAGLIRAAVEAGVPVRVVVLTGGDVGACERYYSKPCGPNEAREFGMVRMEETARALEHLGLARERLSFLGLPDGGSGAIWSKTSNVRPFQSIYLASDHAPYENVLKPNLPYSRGAVIESVKRLIAEVHPAMIATTHPDERHVDHRVTNWFVIKACQELLREQGLDPQTLVLADQTYGAGGAKPAPYRYQKTTLYLSGEAAALKQEMSWIYQSQDGNLTEGKRKTFSELPREEIHYRIVDWEQHEGWNE